MEEERSLASRIVSLVGFGLLGFAITILADDGMLCFRRLEECSERPSYFLAISVACSKLTFHPLADFFQNHVTRISLGSGVPW